MAEERSKYKFPKSLAACADKLYQLRAQRQQMQKEVDSVEAEEKAVKAHIIDNLPKSDASGVAGKLCRVTIISKEIPQLKDDEAFFKYVKKTGRFDLMQRRLSDAAIKEIWENGKEVPGVDHFNAVTLSINKV